MGQIRKIILLVMHKHKSRFFSGIYFVFALGLISYMLVFEIREKILDNIAYDIYGTVVKDTTYLMDKDVVVHSYAEFNVPDIILVGSRVLENSGDIFVSGQIELCDNCRLEIYNRGAFNASFKLGNNASVVQVVSDDKDLRVIDFNVDYDVLVVNADGINLSDVMHLGDAARKIYLRDSFVLWDVGDINSYNISLDGDIRLGLDNIESVLNVPILMDVSPDTYVQVVSGGLVNPLFAMKTFVEKDNTYVRFVRETDYTKFLDYNLGVFINSLRGNGEADELVVALDNALSMDDINKIMADSVRIAPINMTNAVMAFNTLDMNYFNYENTFDATYMLFEDTAVYGAAVRGGVNVGQMDAGIGIYVNLLNATDLFEEYSGLMIGANLMGKYENDFGFLRGKVGGNMTRFDMSNVFDGTKSVDNPVSYSLYGAIDAGHNFRPISNLSVAPYVGIGTNHIEILRDAETEYFGRIGTDVNYIFEMLGIKYEYGVRFGLGTNGDFIVGGRAHFMSDMDMIGGHIGIDCIDNQKGRGYKIAAGIDVKF